VSTDLYRIVYCSRNEIKGTTQEIVNAQLSLLEAARSKNRRLSLTGALISQAGVFVQVIEGPQHSVEHVFSLVQQDDRNSDVTVCLRGPETERDFPKWSMAFADGEALGESSLPQVILDVVFANQEGAGVNLLALLKAHFTHENSVLL